MIKTKMKRKARFAVTLLTVSLMAAMLPAAAFADTGTGQQVNDKSRYLVLGDSISTGYQPSGTPLTDKAFFSIVAKDRGYTLDNKAVAGSRSYDLWNLIKDGSLDDDIRQASLITITIGGNDMMDQPYADMTAVYNKSAVKYGKETITADELPTILADENDPRHGDANTAAITILMSLNKNGDIRNADPDLDNYFAPTLAKYSQNLNNVLNYIRGINPDATIVMETQYYPYYWSDSMLKWVLGDAFTIGVNKLNAAITGLSTDGSGSQRFRTAETFAAFESSFAATPKKVLTCAVGMSLDFHPNTAGHALIAATMENAMLPQIGCASKPAEGLVYDAKAKSLGKVAVSVPATGTEVTYGTSDGVYDLTSVPKETNAGTYTTFYKVKAAGYEMRTGSFTTTIAPKAADTATVSIPDAAYTGRAVTPAATVKIDGVTLMEGTDYTITYSNNRKPGRASYTVTFTGNYSGTKSGTFYITGTMTETGDSSGIGVYAAVMAAAAILAAAIFILRGRKKK